MILGFRARGLGLGLGRGGLDVELQLRAPIPVGVGVDFGPSAMLQREYFTSDFAGGAFASTASAKLSSRHFVPAWLVYKHRVDYTTKLLSDLLN